MKKRIPKILRLDLKTQMALAATTLVFTTTVGLTVASQYLIKNDIKGEITDKQETSLVKTTTDLDAAFVSRRAILLKLSSQINGLPVKTPEAIQAYLAARYDLEVLFDNIHIMDPKGAIIGNLNSSTLLGTTNQAGHDYLQKTLDRKRSVVSSPLKSPVTQRPIVSITAPVLNDKDEVSYVVVGSLDLYKDNFLGGLSKNKVGSTGYYFILTREGTFVSHPTRARVAQNVWKDRITSPVIDRALTDFTGTIESAGNREITALYSFRHMTTTNWTVVSVYPLDEAFVVLKNIQKNGLLAALFLGLLSAPLAWFMTRRQISPLNTLGEQIQTFRQKQEYAYTPQAYGRNEIGSLARAFDELITTRIAAEEDLKNSVRELEQAEQKVRANETLLRGVTDNLPAMVSFIDREGHYRFNNLRYEDYLELPRSDITGRLVKDVLQGEAGKEFEEHFERVLQGETVSYEYGMDVRGNHHHLSAVYIPHKGEDGSVDGVYGMVSDITSLKEVEQQLRLMARFDSLTGLPNRAQYDDEVVKAIARSRRNESSMALMFLDIDKFKTINDTLGHRGGDSVLVEFARRLTSSVRSTDTVARLAGDEFVIIIEGLKQPEGSEVVAEKIIKVMQTPMIIEGQELVVTTSLGIVVREEHETDPQLLLHKADTALYKAKEAGRNKYRRYDEVADGL